MVNVDLVHLVETMLGSFSGSVKCAFAEHCKVN